MIVRKDRREVLCGLRLSRYQEMYELEVRSIGHTTASRLAAAKPLPTHRTT